jgi:hypothetical protein
MQIHELNIRDASVSHDENELIVRFNMEIALLCDEDIERFYTAGNLDTTTLKDAVLKTLTEQIAKASL